MMKDDVEAKIKLMSKRISWVKDNFSIGNTYNWKSHFGPSVHDMQQCEILENERIYLWYKSQKINKVQNYLQ